MEKHTQDQAAFGPVRDTRAFLIVLALVLASALAAALLPSGPPASRLIGSAFDPSTSIVALREQPAADNAIDQATIRPAPEYETKQLTHTGGLPALLLPAELSMRAPFRALGVSRWLVAHRVKWLSCCAISALGARAPPLRD